MPDFHVAFSYLLHAINLRRGTDGFTSPAKEGVLRIFFALKNPTASAGFEPANLGTKWLMSCLIVEIFLSFFVFQVFFIRGRIQINVGWCTTIGRRTTV